MCLQVAEAGSFKEEDQDDDDLCIVCWENMREVIFYHCMHMVRSCSPSLLMLPPHKRFLACQVVTYYQT